MVQLQDKFLSDRLGRKVLLLAPSRDVAARAVKAILFQLSGKSVTAQSEWSYYDAEGEKHGPYGFRKMLHSYELKYFGSGNMLVQYHFSGTTQAWVPVWILHFIENSIKEEKNEILDCEMMDWEETVRDVSIFRFEHASDKYHDSLELPQPREFPSIESAMPMDYDAILEPSNSEGTHCRF